jgi:hypothetical protein
VSEVWCFDYRKEYEVPKLQTKARPDNDTGGFNIVVKDVRPGSREYNREYARRKAFAKKHGGGKFMEYLYDVKMEVRKSVQE